MSSSSAAQECNLSEAEKLAIRREFIRLGQPAAFHITLQPEAARYFMQQVLPNCTLCVCDIPSAFLRSREPTLETTTTSEPLPKSIATMGLPHAARTWYNDVFATLRDNQEWLRIGDKVHVRNKCKHSQMQEWKQGVVQNIGKNLVTVELLSEWKEDKQVGKLVTVKREDVSEWKTAEEDVIVLE
mmetsp:Transcript_14624/g.36527  ORF Transcript_14624/g.36527 Transcript_14624/m.36527 type:complete len:185 (-) Transcript_14624:612-1166(-)